jgi:hypothetical protein
MPLATPVHQPLRELGTRSYLWRVPSTMQFFPQSAKRRGFLGYLSAHAKISLNSKVRIHYSNCAFQSQNWCDGRPHGEAVPIGHGFRTGCISNTHGLLLSIRQSGLVGKARHFQSNAIVLILRAGISSPLCIRALSTSFAIGSPDDRTGANDDDVAADAMEGTRSRG